MTTTTTTLMMTRVHPSDESLIYFFDDSCCSPCREKKTNVTERKLMLEKDASIGRKEMVCWLHDFFHWTLLYLLLRLEVKVDEKEVFPRKKKALVLIEAVLLSCCC